MARAARRVVRVLVWSVATLVVVATAAFFGWRALELPTLDGRIAVAGLSAAVDVVRDEAGIPHVYAANDDDAWFALGWLHADDRLWQMEMSRRTAAGRLAEILGPAALDTDRFLRTIGVHRNAEAIAERLDASTRHALERYAAGVNAELAVRANRPRVLLPPEFLLTGAPRPEPWTPADSIGWATMMAWDLSGNLSSELLRMRLAERLTKRQIDELLPPYPGNPRRDADGHAVGAAVPDAPLPTADYPALYRGLHVDVAGLASAATELLAAAPSRFVDGIGSNDWVVSGARTSSGKPLLADDPHLSMTAPSIWYLAHLSTPTANVIGATLAGLPFVVIGRNDRIAWGVTNTGPDTQDVYVEALRRRGATTEARTPDGWQPLDERDETIRVKGAADVVLRVRSSRHGPLISDVSRGAQDAVATLNGQAGGGAAFALAFQWAALRPDDRTVQAGLGMNRASDWSSFVAALRDFHAPQQNFVYADTMGNIGFIAPGRVPVRRADNDLMGQAPAPGWDARYDWQGFVRFEELPQSLNPPDNRIVTANHKVVPDDYVPFLTAEWAAPYRARRIESLLDATPKHDVASFAAIQGDIRSLAAVELLPLLADTRPPDGPRHDAARDALAALAAWDGTMRGDRAEPLIFAAWIRELTQALVADELGPTLAKRYRAQRTVFLVNVLSDRSGSGDGPSRWCDDVTTPAVERCADMKTLALDRALEDLTKRLGPDRARWRWDALHTLVAAHRPLSAVPSIGRWFELHAPVGGDSNTVDVAGYNVDDDDAPFVARHGPSLREIVDFGDLENSRFVIPTGESGNVLSPWYGDLFDRWRAVRSVPMATARARVEVHAVGTLRLVPP